MASKGSTMQGVAIFNLVAITQFRLHCDWSIIRKTWAGELGDKERGLMSKDYES